MGYSAEKRNKQKTTSAVQFNSILKFLQWLPLYATLIILPFVVHYKLYYSRMYGEPYYIDDIYNFDFNLYYRQLVFLVIAGVAAVVLTVLIAKNVMNIKTNLRKQPGILIPLGLYILFAFLSSICSEHRYGAFTGSDGQFQSFFALLGYCIIVVYLFCLIQSEEDVQRAIVAFAVGMALQALLGILQFFGFELLDYTWYQELITPKGYIETVGPVTNEMPDMLSLCLNNPNYAGVLLSFFAALCLGILLTERKVLFAALELVLFAMLVTALIGTDSAAGILLFGVAATIALVFRFLGGKKKLLTALGATAVLGIGCLVVVFFNGFPVLDHLKEEPNPLSHMTTGNNGVEITYYDTTFAVSIDATGDYLKPLMFDADRRSIPLVLDEKSNCYIADHSVLGNGVVTLQVGIIQQLPAVSVRMNGLDWRFVTTGAGGYYYVNPYKHIEKLDDVERIGFRGYERLATNRGLLWSMALPLLKDTFFLGAGANNFIHIYPQNNYKDIYYYYGQMVTNTKPHNMYLQIATETGVVSLLALLAFWGYYLIQSAKLYWNCTFDTLSKRLGFGCALAVLVYLGCGLANDSMISVAPVFWCIQGVGLAVNWMNKRNLGN